MATAKQITDLLKSFSDRDQEKFEVISLQIAASEEKKGNKNLADQIQNIVSRYPKNCTSHSTEKAGSPLFFSKPEGDLGDLLQIVESKVRISHMVLDSELKNRLSRIIREQKNFNQLRAHNLYPRQRVLLMGSPGCGKTMTASALSTEMGLPLFVVKLDALFTKFLGETSSKLRLIFDAIQKTRGVFLFDEFDSIGLARGSQHDVAEMRRVLNTFLVLIENLQGYSLIIAASNHPEVLDKALFRRFDDLIKFKIPSLKELEVLLKNRIAGTPKTKINWQKIRPQLAGLSYADAARIADEAMKEVIINDYSELKTENLETAIKERKYLHHD